VSNLEPHGSHRLHRPDTHALLNPRVSVFGNRGERLFAQKRRPSLLLNVVGLTLTVVGVGIAISGIVDVIDGGPDVVALLITGIITAIVGAVMWQGTVAPKQIRVLDVFTTVTIAWVTIAAVGAIPYLVTGHFTRVDDALFEGWASSCSLSPCCRRLDRAE
jgi:trk system potassium uptake protein TrkH